MVLIITFWLTKTTLKKSKFGEKNGYFRLLVIRCILDKKLASSEIMNNLAK